MKLKYFMLSLLLTWITLTTAAQVTYGKAPDNRHSHSALLNIHHPGGSRLHSYHRRGPHGNGVLYVHRQGSPPSPLVIHRISSPYNQHSKLIYPRTAEDVENLTNRSAVASIPTDSPDSGRAVALSSVLLAPTGYFKTEEINRISDKMPVETIVYPLAKAIQKHYVPRQLPFYVRLPPGYPLRHIPVGMVVTPPAAPQYFRSSNWYSQKDEIPLEERTPSLPTPRPSSLPPRPSSPPPSSAPLPPLYFPTHNYYTFVPAKNQTSNQQPPVPALHPPHHFPYKNCYAPAPESDEQTPFSLQSSEPSTSKYESYDSSELKMQQNNARSEGNVDTSSRSPEQASSNYFPNSAYQPYEPSKLQVHAKVEARTLPHHHASYHETISHTPLLIHEGHGEGIHKHIIIHHSKPPFAHRDLVPTLYDDVHLQDGEHSTYVHEEPILHGHLSLNLGRNAPTYDITNMPHNYYGGFQPPLLSTNFTYPWPVTSSIPYGYGNPSPLDYSSIPYIVKPSIPLDVQQNTQPNVPYLLRRLRSFEGSEHKSTSDLGNLASESDKSLTISLPVDMSNTAENETTAKLQKKEAISGDDNPDFHPETAKLLDLPQVLNSNEVRKRLILEAILSREASSEKKNTHKTMPPIESDRRSFSKDFSEINVLHQAEMGDEAHVKQLHQDVANDSFMEVKDVSLQSIHHEPKQAIASLDTLWQKMKAKRNKRQTSQKQNNNTSPDSDSRTIANVRSQGEGIGFVIGFLDPEAYNYYFGSENNQNIASDQTYYYLSDYKQGLGKPSYVPFPIYNRQSNTGSYTPVAKPQYDYKQVEGDVPIPDFPIPDLPIPTDYRQSKTDSYTPVAKPQYDYKQFEGDFPIPDLPIPTDYRQSKTDSYTPVAKPQYYYKQFEGDFPIPDLPIPTDYRQSKTDSYTPVAKPQYYYKQFEGDFPIPDLPIPTDYRQSKTDSYTPFAKPQYDYKQFEGDFPIPDLPIPTDYRQSNTDSYTPVAKPQYDYKQFEGDFPIPDLPIPTDYRQSKTDSYTPVAKPQYDYKQFEGDFPIPDLPIPTDYRQSKTDSYTPVAKPQYDYKQFEGDVPIPTYYRQSKTDSYVPFAKPQYNYDDVGHIPIPVYYRQKETDPYIPINLMSYKETATNDSGSVKVTNPNITTKNADGYWTYNKTARYDSFGGNSFPLYYEPYPVQHNSHNPELVPVPYHQFVERVIPHPFLNKYPAKMLNLKLYPMHSYSSNKQHDSSISYQRNSKHADLSEYAEEPQMNAGSFSNMGPANEHPIRYHHHPNRYNTHIPAFLQANVRPHNADVHPIAHHPRPSRYYALISQEPELDSRPYHNFNGAKVPPIQHHRPSRYYAHLHRYPYETQTDARSFRNIDDIKESPARQHYTSRYYEHASGYPLRDTRLYDYDGEREYYHPSRYFYPAPATPYSDDLIGPYHLGAYEYPYQPNGDITSHKFESIHQHPTRYHHLRRYHERYHGHSYQPSYHMERFPPPRYHHSHRYHEHVHGNAYRSQEEATPDSKIPETNNQTFQMRNYEEEADEYPQKMQSGSMIELLHGSNYANKYYTGSSPKSQIALVSFFTTDKQGPYPNRFHRLGPYGPMYHPSQYMNTNREGEYNTAGYFSKMRA